MEYGRRYAISERPNTDRNHWSFLYKIYAPEGATGIDNDVMFIWTSQFNFKQVFLVFKL